MIPTHLTKTSRSRSPSPEDIRPKKKGKGKGKGKGKATHIKTEFGSGSGASSGSDLRPAKANPPLVPFSQAARFHTHCYIDLTRASIDLRIGDTTMHESIPVSLIPNADINAMSILPIVQSPKDATKTHPRLPQPASINYNMPLRQGSKPSDAVYQARDKMDQLLRHPDQRENHERKHFKLAKINDKHIKQQIAPGKRHATVGSRGVVAATPLHRGTPLHYSGQYLNSEDYQDTTQALSLELQQKTGMGKTQADTEAKRLIAAYLWEGITYKGTRYDISSFGAGNTAAMINHDEQHPNMGVAYMSTHDQEGKPAPPIVVYFALCDIAKDEQLLVNYGECYQFNKPMEGSMDMQENWPEPAISANMLQAINTLNTVKDEASPLTTNPNQAEDLLAASILSGFSSEDMPGPASTGMDTIPQASASSATGIPLAANRQQALQRFNQTLDQKIKHEGRRLDIRTNAPFFFQQPSIPLKIKQRSLGDILLCISERNEFGSLGSLRFNWTALTQLQPKVDPVNVLIIASNKGGKKAVGYIQEHWHKLNQLQPVIAPQKLLSIAKHAGASKVLEYLNKHWTTINQLISQQSDQPELTTEQIATKLLAVACHEGSAITLSYLLENWHKINPLRSAIGTEKVLDIAANNGGSITLVYLQKNWSALKQLQPTISTEKLLEIANHDGGSRNLAYIQKNWADLNQQLSEIPPETLLEIANISGGRVVLENVKQNWGELKRLQPTIPPTQLLKIACNPGGSGTLTYLQQNWSQLNQLQPPIDAEVLLSIAKKKCSSNMLDYLLNNWPALNQLQPAIATDKLLEIANHDSGSKTLDYLQANWHKLNQLQPPIAPDTLVAIANKNGSGSTLDVMKENWSALISFTNNHGEHITAEQVVGIGNRKSAKKRLEALLYNDHIKTLKMDEILSILVNESRSAKFMREHPNKF